jgi:hypothetical protein
MGTKKEYVVSNSTGLRQPKYTHLNEGEITQVKGKIRSDVEKISTTDDAPYDIEDQLADATNAMNALLAIADAKGWNVEIAADAAITKYKARQLSALTIVSTHTS